MAMYGGDEVSAIVLDLGSHTCKAGYAGEDAPKAVFPSVVGVVEQANDGDAPPSTTNEQVTNGEDGKAKPKGRKLYVGVNALGYRRDHMEVAPSVRDGLIHDWEAVEAIWDHAFKDRLLIDPKEHPLLLAEPSFNTQPIREKCVELIFEKYEMPALFLAKNAVLTSFASGRATSLVVDSGGGSTTVAAVNDGYVLQKSILRSPVGGELLTECLYNTLQSKGIQVKPRYSFKRKEVRPGEFEVTDLELAHTAESYRKYAQMQIVADMKEAVCRVPEGAFEESAYVNIPTTPYELPDGQVIEVGSDRFKVADIIFNPSHIKSIAGMEKWEPEGGLSLQGLPRMVVESINKCDADIRRELFGGVLLAGGNAVMQQMKERLEKELGEEAPQAARVKVLASGNAMERRFSVWIGGSILASLGSFQQMWLSKQEYQEHGASYVHRKCP